MQTDVLKLDPEHPQPESIAQAAALLRAGEVVAFPTETVYGLGAIATNADAVARIFAAKGRPSTDPLIVHIADIEQIEAVTGDPWFTYAPAIRHLGETYWPGPLTLVLPRGRAIPPGVTAGLATVGVRMPRHPVALALIAATGAPIAAPSANTFGHTSPTTAQHVLDDLGGRIPLILDGGPCPVGIESTILDVTGDDPVLLRPGGIPVEDLELVLGVAIRRLPPRAIAAGLPAAAPGMLLSHYAPRAPLVVFEGRQPEAVWERVVADIQRRAAIGAQVGALAPVERAAELRAAGAAVVVELGPAADLAAAARTLFAGLRALDDAGVSVIIVASFPGEGLALALRDRLRRAAGGQIEKV